MAPKPTSTPATVTAINPLQTLWKAYNDNTANRLKFIDSFLFFLMLSGIIQFAYCILVSNYPYNAFLSGYVVARNLSFKISSHASSVSQVPSVNSYWWPHYVHKSTQKTRTSSKMYHQNGMCIMVLYMCAQYDEYYAVRLRTLQ